MAVFSLLLMLMIGSLQASKISFSSSPKSIQPSLTKTLTLSCSLQDSGLPPGAVIGRSVTSTSYDVAHVISVVIMRDGQDLASVTAYTPAQSAPGMGNLTVVGDVNGANTTKGYLNVTWTYPSYKEIGEFTCEVEAVSQTGHGVIFSQVMEVDILNTTVDDLKNFVNQLESRLSSVEVEQSKAINESKAKDNELMAKDKQMEELLDEMKKIESGTIQCGGGGWTEIGDRQRKQVTVHFQKPYRNTPHVQLSLMYIDDYLPYSDKDDEFGVDLLSVNPTSFTIECFILNGKMLQSMKAGWISAPKF